MANNAQCHMEVMMAISLSIDSNTHGVQTGNNENDMLQAVERKHNYVYVCYTMKSISNHIRGVPGGMCQTSGECSLG